MFHYNQLVKEKSLLGVLEALAIPEIYFASSLHDFVEGRESIKPTSLLQEMLFDIRSFPQQMYVGGKAVVMIPAVRYQGCYWNIVGLEDLTNKIATVVFFPREFKQFIKKESIEPGNTVGAVILYDTKIDFPYLLLLTKNTFPKSPHFAAERGVSLADLILSPA